MAPAAHIASRVGVKLVLVALFWALNMVAGRIMAQAMPAFPAAFLRFFTGSAALALVAFLRRDISLRPPLSSLPGLALLGLTGVFLYNWCFFSGLATVTVARAGAISAGIPAVVAILAALAFRDEALTRARALGVALAVAGTLVIVARGDPAALLHGSVGLGDLYMLGSVLAWAAYSLLGKRVMQQVEPLTAVIWACFTGALMLLPFALAQGLAAHVASATAPVWASVAFTGIFATGVCYLWYYDGVKAIGPARAAVYINLVPVLTIGIGAVWEGVPPALELAAAGLTIAGVALTQRREKARRE